VTSFLLWGFLLFSSILGFSSWLVSDGNSWVVETLSAVDFGSLESSVFL